MRRVKYRRYQMYDMRYFKLRVSRSERVSRAGRHARVYIHQGRTWVKLYPTRFHVGYAFGMFACTKKPFCFKPKKKKKR